jgi:hypothetical protein
MSRVCVFVKINLNDGEFDKVLAAFQAIVPLGM